MDIHPTAVIEEGARLGNGCVIHAYAVIGSHCELGDGVVVHPFAAIGGDPQDLSFDLRTDSGVRIGARTVIREHVTISRATKAGGATVIGADCFLMASCHVAHDCRIGDRVVIANAALLAGHVHIGDHAFIGGGALFHQFVRVGASVMVSGGARISMDAAPYMMVAERNDVIGLNVVGLRRRGFSREVVEELKRAFLKLTVPVGNLKEIAAANLRSGEFTSAEARNFLEFFAGSRRGFVRARRGASAGGV